MEKIMEWGSCSFCDDGWATREDVESGKADVWIVRPGKVDIMCPACVSDAGYKS